jgi:hypothetical protein
VFSISEKLLLNVEGLNDARTPLADFFSILLEHRSLTPARLFKEERALRKGLVAPVGDLLAMRLQALEDLPTPRFDYSAESFDILVARRHQSTSIFLPLHKSLLQLALARRRKLFGTLLQTARAGRTVRRVGAQLFDLGFALQPGSLQRKRIQPRHNRSFNT